MFKRLKCCNAFRNTLFLFLFLYSFLGCQRDFLETKTNSYKETVFERFNPLWSWYLESSNGGWLNNDNGRFSNDDAPATESLLELYTLTNDVRYLELLYDIGEKMMNNDDINRKVFDEHRGNRILPGWSSIRYTKDKSRTIFLMDDALILIPMIRAYSLLKNTPNYKYAPEKWLFRAEQEFEEIFKNEWKEVSITEGYFEDTYYAENNLNMPTNQYAIVGELCMVLYEATNNEKYKNYAIKTANYLKKNFIIIDDSYVWYYKKPNQKYPEKIYDDFSHAQLVWRFVNVMYKQNLVFKKKDIDLMVGTFMKQVMNGDQIFWFFGGKFNENTIAPPELLYKEDAWLHYFYSLSEYNKEIKNTLIKYQFTRKVSYDKYSDYNHIAELVLLHYVYDLRYLN